MNRSLVFCSSLLRLIAPAAICLLTAWATLAAPVPRYPRFEHTLESASSYNNAPQEATLTATFTAPDGAKQTIPGFWDGGKTWRIRFQPTQLGRYTFETRCSDAGNLGLH